jgi:hypothetical protein
MVTDRLASSGRTRIVRCRVGGRKALEGRAEPVGYFARAESGLGAKTKSRESCQPK